MATPTPPVESVKDTIDNMLLLSALREDGKAELLEILESIPGSKCLVTDVQLGGLLNQVIVEGSRFLKDNDVDHFKELRDEGLTFTLDGVHTVPDHIIYLVRPQLPLMSLIANQIKAADRNGVASTFHVYFVPQQFTVCVHLLKEHIDKLALFDRIRFGEYKLGLIPFDTDILSLEMDGCYKQCNVDGDYSSLNIIAEALLQLQMTFGVIPNVRSKGNAARKVLQKMMAMRVEELEQEQAALQQQQQNALSSGSGKHNTSNSSDHMHDLANAVAGVTNSPNSRNKRTVAEKYNSRSEIDLLVILDRDVDLVSPLVTPLTYEGLIDDTVGIENARVKLDAAVLGTSEQQEAMSATMAASATAGKAGVDGAAAAAAAAATLKASVRVNDGKVAVPLSNNDAIYAEIRDLSIERLGAYLQEKAIHIRERYTTFRDNKEASITEIHDFVKKIPKLTMEYKSLNQHINIAEMLKQRTNSRAFLDQWQGERGMLEGDSHLDEIEDALCGDTKRTQLLRVLRLLCLQSLTAGGIRATRYDAFRRLIVHTYGYQHLYTMANLEKAGLLKRKDAILVVELSSQWTALRKQLRLIDERANDASQDSISYVTAGYAPLLVRLVQLLCVNGVSWNCIADSLRQLPGPVLEFTQQPAQPEDLSEALERMSHEALAQHGGTAAAGTGSTQRTDSTSAASPFGAASALSSNAFLSYTTGMMSSAASATTGGFMGGAGGRASQDDAQTGSSYTGLKFGESVPQDKKTMLLFVVGGLSYLEIAACRFLSNDPAFPYRIMLGTTKLINGSTFVSSLKHDFN